MSRSIGYGRSRWLDRASVDMYHDQEDARAEARAWDQVEEDLEPDEPELALLDDLRYGATYMARFVS
jgi:hypothetical protein